MNIHEKHWRTIWVKKDNPEVIQIIDQRFLPHELVVEDLKTVEDVVAAIQEMHVRGAPLIGVAAAYGMYLGALHAPSGFKKHMAHIAERLKTARPTAVNLSQTVALQWKAVESCATVRELIAAMLKTATRLAEEDIAACKQIGNHGLKIIQEIYAKKRTVNILTHCNAGWLACVDYGTATAPIYAAGDHGINLHVYVDETRPRNQGARLTAWELGMHGIPHTLITDSMAGHLMQRGFVDMIIVGSDRITRNGDVVNKIGTYMLALAAHDNHVPFYAAFPSTTIDWQTKDSDAICIEQRSEDEVLYVEGMDKGKIRRVLVPPSETHAINYAFDVTPARLITGFITERGVCAHNRLSELYPEHTP